VITDEEGRYNGYLEATFQEIRAKGSKELLASTKRSSRHDGAHEVGLLPVRVAIRLTKRHRRIITLST